MKTLLAWLRLLRIPNHATAAADVLAGGLVISQPRVVDWPPAGILWAMAAGISFYAGGMVLNDVFDLEIDRRERPERPLPSGAIDVRLAAAVGQVLLAVGGVCSCLAAFVSGHPEVALVGALLTTAVWIYDRHAKSTPFGPAVMGSCRSLNWLLGMTAAGGPTLPYHWLLPIGMGLYAAGVTLFARNEAGRTRGRLLVAATLVIAAGLAAAATQTWLMAAAGGGGTWLREGRLTSWFALWGMLSASILGRNLFAALDPSPFRVQAAVGNCIMSIITLDAVLVLAACGESWSVVVLSLLVPFVIGRQLVPPT
jgi:4-hydroxybenzoate polyprenyltransferase